MSRIWSEEGRLARWLEVELAALDGWAELGTIPAADVAAIRAGAKPPTPERVAEIERVTDHDLAAFVDAVAEQLGPEGRWVHYGLTSSDVVDTDRDEARRPLKAAQRFPATADNEIFAAMPVLELDVVSDVDAA